MLPEQNYTTVPIWVRGVIFDLDQEAKNLLAGLTAQYRTLLASPLTRDTTADRAKLEPQIFSLINLLNDRKVAE